MANYLESFNENNLLFPIALISSLYSLLVQFNSLVFNSHFITFKFRLYWSTSEGIELSWHYVPFTTDWINSQVLLLGPLALSADAAQDC